MPEERQFKVRRFSGFDKSEVMEYIALMKEREAEMQREIDKLRARNAELKKQTDAAIATLEDEKLAREQELEALRVRCADAEERYAQKDAYSRKLEERIGSTMIDVRRFADTIVSETTERIGVMSDETDAAVRTNLESVTEIADRLRDCASRVGELFDEIEGENESLAQLLRDFLGSLNIPYTEARDRLYTEMDLNTDPRDHHGDAGVQDGSADDAQQTGKPILRIKRKPGGRRTGYVIPGDRRAEDEQTDEDA